MIAKSRKKSSNSFAIASLSLTKSPFFTFTETVVLLDVFVVPFKSFSNLYTFLESPIHLSNLLN